MSSKDKKNPEKIIYYQSTQPQDDGQNGDLQQILSFLLGFLGMMMRQKIFLWGSLFMLLSSFANLKSSTDTKQLIINTGVVILGMLSLYVWQPRMIEQQIQQQKQEENQQ